MVSCLSNMVVVDGEPARRGYLSVFTAHTCLYVSAYVHIHVFRTEATVFLHCLSLSPTLRRSLSSSYVWRLRQTSSASSSSPSNGCFSLPAPTYGSSMSGTQVSPSFLWTVLSLPAKQPLSPQRLGAKEIRSCQVSSV